MNESPLGKKRMERIKDAIVERYVEKVNDVIDLLMADGDTPPFMERKTAPTDIMAQLLAWRDAQDPRYWQSTQAQATLRQLQTKYGEGLPAIGEVTPPQPAVPSAETAALLGARQGPPNVLGAGQAPPILPGGM